MFSKSRTCLKLLFAIILLPAFTHFSSYAQDSAQREKQRLADSTRKADSAKQAKVPKVDIKKDTTKTADTTKAAQDTSKDKEPRVLRVYSYNTNDSAASIGDIIVLEVYHLDALLKRAEDADKNVSLYINGREISNIKPISGAPDRDKGTLQYRLDRNSENDVTWADILGAPPILSDDFFDKPVKISAGLSGKSAIKTVTDDTNFNLVRIHRGWFWLCCGIVLLYLFIFFRMARQQGLLRDRSIDLSALNVDTAGINNSFSLGRFQMAFWFTITLISFFFIWLITDAYNIISSTVLALIGISTMTSISAAVIDNSKSTDLLNQTIALDNELKRLNVQIQALQSQIAVIPAPADSTTLASQLLTAQNRVNEITPIIAQNTLVLTPTQSQGFLRDILTDANGVSFHRLQMFVWTFVLGLIFLYSVWKRLSMPEFDATLLALQGLTSVTYLGFKFPEKQA